MHLIHLMYIDIHLMLLNLFTFCGIIWTVMMRHIYNY